MGAAMSFNPAVELVEQLTWHWDAQARPRLHGLTDEEYFWEPVEGCWNVRRRGTSTAQMAVGAGDFVIEFAVPEPKPPPFTTVAWRLNHILVGVLGSRNASHFGGPEVGYESFDYPATAVGALALLDEYYERWLDGVRALGEDGLGRPCGPAEGHFADRSMGTLVLHINREMIHHLAEIALLRDLFAHRQ
jgi:hypothetical protein